MWSKILKKFSISGKEKEKPSVGSCHSSLYTVIHNIFLFFIIVAVRFRAFVGGVGRFVGGVGVRSTGFGRNRVLRDWNLFILQGYEGAKCRICVIFGTSRKMGTGWNCSGGTRGQCQGGHVVFVAHKGHFSVRFLARGLRQLVHVVFVAGEHGEGGTFPYARTMSEPSHRLRGRGPNVCGRGRGAKCRI